MNHRYPVFMDVTGRRCVVVGGGAVAGRKAATLWGCGAAVVVVAPELGSLCTELAAQKRIEHRPRPFEPADLDGAFLAFAATGDESVNAAVAAEAGRRSVPVNVVEGPERSTFIVPSKVTRGDLTVAVSTGGASPAVAKRIRRRLESEFGPEWEPYLALLSRARETILSGVEDPDERRALFDRLADSELFDLVRGGNLAAAEALVAQVAGPGMEQRP